MQLAGSTSHIGTHCSISGRMQLPHLHQQHDGCAARLLKTQLQLAPRSSNAGDFDTAAYDTERLKLDDQVRADDGLVAMCERLSQLLAAAFEVVYKGLDAFTFWSAGTKARLGVCSARCLVALGHASATRAHSHQKELSQKKTNSRRTIACIHLHQGRSMKLRS